MPGTDGGQLTTGMPPQLGETLGDSAERTARTSEPDPEMLSQLRRSGVLATAVPEEFGGAGGDACAVNRAVERIATVNPSAAIIAFQHFAVTMRITEWGSDAQRSRWLPGLADGTCLAASAWSESGAGAAKQNLRSVGTPRPDGRWLLDGAKTFATGAGVADLYLVLVRTGELPAEGDGYGAHGQTFFVVDADNPGLVTDRGPGLTGMRGSATGLLALRECVVDDADRLGPEHEAARIIAGVRESGASLGAVSVGAAQAAFDLVVEHARRNGLLELPTVRHRLVELAVRLESARGIVELAGARSTDEPGLTTLRSKLHASVTAEEICLEIARMMGSAGYQETARINRLLADARGVALMGPTNDVCRDLLAATWKS